MRHEVIKSHLERVLCQDIGELSQVPLLVVNGYVSSQLLVTYANHLAHSTSRASILRGQAQCRLLRVRIADGLDRPADCSNQLQTTDVGST